MRITLKCPTVSSVRVDSVRPIEAIIVLPRTYKHKIKGNNKMWTAKEVKSMGYRRNKAKIITTTNCYFINGASIHSSSNPRFDTHPNEEIYVHLSFPWPIYIHRVHNTSFKVCVDWFETHAHEHFWLYIWVWSVSLRYGYSALDIAIKFGFCYVCSTTDDQKEFPLSFPILSLFWFYIFNRKANIQRLL